MKSFYQQKCRICGCDWNHACNDHDYWFAEDLCSACAEKMKPILFNTEMVQVILDGRKTTTRRVIKPKCKLNFIGSDFRGRPMECRLVDDETQEIIRSPQPSYQIGDVLYVRETWNADWCDHVIYKADGGSAMAAGYGVEPKWHPSIHMPKEAARIFLRVTGVRAERLQKITEEQAKNEGICGLCYDAKTGEEKYDMSFFEALWNSTVKPADRDKYGWNANPWVWVISFERIDKSKEMG